jgi:hypothetical protein
MDGGFRRRHSKLLLAEGLAVGALLIGGVHLVGSHLDVIKRAVISGIAVIGTLLDGTGDALVCVAVHKNSSFLLGSDLVWLRFANSSPFQLLNIAFFFHVCYFI